MFLHLGNDIYVHQNDIIAVCNLDTASVSKNTQIYLKKAEDLGIVETICSDIPKTFVIVRRNNRSSCKSLAHVKRAKGFLTKLNNKDRVYLTNISSVTLLKRSENEAFNQFDV